jgi:membrane protease YdiL (CAAX protease family)
LYALPLVASGSWLLVIIGITAGSVWTLVRLRSNGILVSLVSHGMWSCATFIAFPLA